VLEAEMAIAIVPRVSGGSVTDEFEEIFREHYQLVYRTAYGLTGRREDAEDVLQTIFLRLLQRDVSPELKKNPKKYLYRAAVNASLDTIRTRKRQRLIPTDDFFDFPSVAPDPTSEDDIGRRLLDALARLNPKMVEVVILRYQQGYSDAQIAAMLGKSRGVVAVTLYRARARLRKLVSDSGGQK